MCRAGEKLLTVHVLGPAIEFQSDKCATLPNRMTAFKPGQTVKTAKFFHKHIAHAIICRHNRGLRLAKGVGICPN
jgi:hypothetical protein